MLSFRHAAVIPLLCILASSGILPARTLEVGEQLCVEGFVMDFYCINRKFLLDRESIRTLENPELHSVHCLVDVDLCSGSPYEILLDPLSGETLFARGWRMDDHTKDRIIALARRVGSCSTCDNRQGLIQGFRAALNATVLDLGTSSVPPLISAVDVQQSELGNVFCAETNLADSGSSTDTGNFVSRPPPIRITDSGGSDLQKKYYTHASLMLIGWGWLLPSGTIFARLFKHRPDGLWFKMHKVMQTIGLLFAIVGWVSTCASTVVRMYS